MSPLDRFRKYCRFDPVTGCVIWIGGRTRGRGNTAEYGRFWFDGKSWLAHRWSAIYIHKLPIENVTAGHCCPHGHNTLCVEHIRPETLADNVAERNTRIAAERKYWLLVERGYEPPPEIERDDAEIPYYLEPEWLRCANQQSKT